MIRIDHPRADVARAVDIRAARLRREKERHFDVLRQRKRRAVERNRRQTHFFDGFPVVIGDRRSWRQAQFQSWNTR